MAFLNDARSVICISDGVKGKCGKQSQYDNRCRAAHLPLGKRHDELAIGLHMESFPELHERPEKRVHKDHHQKDEKVDGRYSEE